MTLRSIFWINDSGLLVGRTTIGLFAASPPALGVLSVSATAFTLGVPAAGAISGNTGGSSISAAGLPTGFTIDGACLSWAYDGTGSAGSSNLQLIETLSGSPNSPQTTSITITIAAASGTALDFSQPANSGLIAALRSF